MKLLFSCPNDISTQHIEVKIDFDEMDLTKAESEYWIKKITRNKEQDDEIKQ